MPKSKIVVGICTGGTIRAEMAVSLYSALIHCAQEDLAPNLLVQIGGYVDVNRNKIVESALNQGATHIMFIDNDMIFPDDGILKLLSHDKDIVGANYNVRLDPTSKDPTGPTTKALVDGKPVSMLTKDFPIDLFKCYAVATGFVLIKAKVFTEMKRPYFRAFTDEDGLHHTEDVEFCKSAQELGFEVYCDPSIKIGHIGSTIY